MSISRMRYPVGSNNPPFDAVAFKKVKVVPSYDPNSSSWYITVVHKKSGRHLHFEYTGTKSVVTAVMVAKRANQGYTPSHYSKESKRSIIYLIAGGDKPSVVRKRHNNPVKQD